MFRWIGSIIGLLLLVVVGSYIYANDDRIVSIPTMPMVSDKDTASCQANAGLVAVIHRTGKTWSNIEWFENTAGRPATEAPTEASAITLASDHADSARLVVMPPFVACSVRATKADGGTIRGDLSDRTAVITTRLQADLDRVELLIWGPGFNNGQGLKTFG